MRQWLTAREIADAALPGLPATKSGLIRFASAAGWDNHPSFCRERSGQGGGLEYHYHLLPALAQIAWAQRNMTVGAPAEIEPAPLPADDGSLSARGREERDARLAVVKAYEVFIRGLNLGHATHLQVFCAKYNAGSIDVAGWVRELVPTVAKRSLMRWRKHKRDGKTTRLARDPGQARKGTGVLDTAEGGRVRMHILGLIAAQPFLSAHHVRTLCRAEFGDCLKTVSKGVETTVELPPVRTFQHALKTWKVEHRVELLKLTNPDKYRSTMKPTGRGALRHVTEPNQLWQIDASPVDALCVDGRHTVYVCIDIATRRQVFSLSRTPRAEAVALLLRKAILAWGVPDTIKTDNGSDFVAKATQQLLASLGIEVELSDAYSPEQKGHVERAIRTFQHDLGPQLPGFVGHSVADRKAIEGRKSFAARLGESDAETFGVTLTATELQRHVDHWADLVLSHRPHAGLNNGTPAEAARRTTRPLRVVDERALDLLLMPVAGMRTMTKSGLRIDGRHYMSPSILPGTIVSVRMDPLDLGKVYAFAEDGGAFLDEAICPELSGIDPRQFVRQAKALERELVDAAVLPIKAEMKRIKQGPTLIERTLQVAQRDADARDAAASNVVPLPRREEPHTTPQIAAAIDAMAERINPTKPLSANQADAHRRLIAEMQAEEDARVEVSFREKYERRMAEIEAERTAHLPADDKVVALRESPKASYRRAVLIRRRIDAGEDVPPFDAFWCGTYETSAEFRGQQAMHADFGDAYLSL